MAPGARGGRIVVAVVMGGTAFALAVLLVAAAGLSVTVAPVVAVLAGAGLLAVWLARRKASLRSAWSRGCLVNSLLSAGAAVGFHAQNELWSARSQYARWIRHRHRQGHGRLLECRGAGRADTPNTYISAMREQLGTRFEGRRSHLHAPSANRRI